MCLPQVSQMKGEESVVNVEEGVNPVNKHTHYL